MSKTEQDLELILRVAEEYWLAFSKLVAEHLEKVPHELQDDLLDLLEDRSSAHGSDFTTHMKRPPPFVERFQRILKGNK